MKHVLRTRFWILAAGVTLILSCGSSDTNSAGTSETEIILTEYVQISCEGGPRILEYTVTRPVEGAVVIADAGGADWIDGTDTSVEGIIAFEAEENEEDESRMAVMTVRYVYDGGEAVAVVNLIQDAAGYTYDFSIENAYGIYFGALDRTPGMRYVLCLTEKSVESGSFGPGLNYRFDIYAERPADLTDIRLPEGLYELSRNYEPGCLNSDNTYMYDGDTERHLFFIKCSLSISYDGDNIVAVADILDQNGETHRVCYTGLIVFDDQSYYSSFDSDYQAVFSGCSGEAEYLGDYYGNGCSTFAVEIVPVSGNGQYLMLELLAPESANVETGIPSGSYAVDWSEREFTVLPGILIDGYMANSWLSACENNSVVKPWSPLSGGSVDISADGGIYTITLRSVDDNPMNPHSLIGTWSGEIEIK